MFNMDANLSLLRPLIPKHPLDCNPPSPKNFLFSQRTKKLTRSLDEAFSKIYSDVRNHLKLPKKTKKHQSLNPKDKINNPKVFPSIYPANIQASKVKMNLMGKEERLEDLISTFMCTRTPKPRLTRERLQTQRLIDRDMDGDESKVYEKYAQSLGEKKRLEEQRNLQKSLKIEMIRKQQQKRIKTRLQSL